MMNYNKNELINTTLDKYYETFSHMLDTSDYVPEKFNDKIGKYIFKNLKKTFKLIDGEDRKYQKQFKKEINIQEKVMSVPNTLTILPSIFPSGKYKIVYVHLFLFYNFICIISF